MKTTSITLATVLFLTTSALAQDWYLRIETAQGVDSFRVDDIRNMTFERGGNGGEPEPGEERDFPLTDDVNITMVWIPAGEFMMGAREREQDAEDDEYPRHQVTFENGFWMGKYEVTQAQWEAVMGENPAHDHGVGANYPVYYVSWNEIQTFESETEHRFRLPSESEWEYAYRAGTTTRFYWGDDPNFSDIDRYAVYVDNAPNGTAEVGTKRPNVWGLYDMSGNVYEWCQDWYHDDYEGAPSDGSAWISPEGNARVIRGGSWNRYARYCRSSDRYWGNPVGRDDDLGFRLVRDAE